VDLIDLLTAKTSKPETFQLPDHEPHVSVHKVFLSKNTAQLEFLQVTC
jgi:hypothetical protein